MLINTIIISSIVLLLLIFLLIQVMNKKNNSKELSESLTKEDNALLKLIKEKLLVQTNDLELLTKEFIQLKEVQKTFKKQLARAIGITYANAKDSDNRLEAAINAS